MQVKTELMPHQKVGTDKLIQSRIGALFAEMGLGKSRMAIELALRRKKRIQNVIWYCPVSLKTTVKHEILKHTDSKDGNIYLFDDKTNSRNIPMAFWNIVGTESMSMSNRIIFASEKITRKDSMIVVDESEYIKGHRSKRTKFITKISEKAMYRLIMTGTPISQGVVDLFAQFYFLSPKILGYRSFYSFAANHLEYSDQYPGLIVRSHNTQYLAEKIKPYTYQVTKSECIDLPDKIYSYRYFDMTYEQREVYEQAKNEFLLESDPDEWNSYTIFQLFTTLQRIASGYTKINNEIIDLVHDRIDMLVSVINQIPDNEKIIIWSKYHYDIKKISDCLIQSYGNDSYSEFHGGLNEKKRNYQLDKFRHEARFFNSTTSCGGHGLTLNESTYVIYYNRPFKYSEYEQSEDRNHRIGQARKVTYTSLICEKSIDERIDISLKSKGNVVQSFKYEMDKQKDKNSLKKMIKNL